MGFSVIIPPVRGHGLWQPQEANAHPTFYLPLGSLCLGCPHCSHAEGKDLCMLFSDGAQFPMTETALGWSWGQQPEEPRPNPTRRQPWAALTLEIEMLQPLLPGGVRDRLKPALWLTKPRRWGGLQPLPLGLPPIAMSPGICPGVSMLALRGAYNGRG